MANFPSFRFRTMFNSMKVLMWVSMIVYFISRLTKIKNSEFYSYGTLLGSIIVSMVLLLGLSTKNAKQDGVISMLMKIIRQSTPGLILSVQLIIMIVIYSLYGEKIYDMESLPTEYNIFNNIAFVFLLLQLFIYNKFISSALKKYDNGDSGESKWAGLYIPLFILGGVISSGSILKLWVIMSKLLTDG